MYCPECHEDVQARRDVPGLGAFAGGSGPALGILTGWLLGKESQWTCSQCSGPIPLDPEEKHRQIATAIFIMIPLALTIVLILIVVVLQALGLRN
ncbi:MAG: hypothetical protein NT049_14055 [Planctomycetota bacterium]|nr:hypothetical protein [Planctomycetota bacterium]